MAFWGLALILALLVAAIPGLALWRGRAAADPGAGADLALYRDQLAEVTRDLERGVLDEAEAERLQVEISRRLLDADKRLQGAERASRIARPGLALTLAGGIVAASVALYVTLGAPGYTDLPIDERLAEADRFRATRPRQAAFVALLPERAQAALAELGAEAEAQARRLEELGENATSADYTAYADLLIGAAGGYVSPEAERALARALEIDPRNPLAYFYVGEMFAQTGRPDRTFEFWRPLLENAAPGDPWVPVIAARIEAIAFEAGIPYELPEHVALRGPSAADIEAAGQMEAADQQAMIEAMVAGLADRLATEGGSPEEWAQLIRALGVQGRQAEAAEIYAEAQAVFAGAEAALRVIADAAQGAGVAE